MLFRSTQETASLDSFEKLLQRGKGGARMLFSLLSHVRLFATPWTAARQASLSITNSRSLLKLMSIDLVTPSNHLILCHPLLLLPSIFPSIRVFPMSQLIQFSSVAQSCLTLFDPMNCSTPGLPVHHQLLELAQTHVHQVSDGIQP